VCSDRKVKRAIKETYFYCKTHTNQPAICPGEYFKRYHTLNYFKSFSAGPTVYRIFVDFVHRRVIVIRRKEYVYALYYRTADNLSQ
jgi:hypothetical protein